MASRCFLCGKAEEVLDHLLIHRHSIWDLWTGLISIPGLDWVCPRLARGIISSEARGQREFGGRSPIDLFLAIWKARNMIVFED